MNQGVPPLLASLLTGGFAILGALVVQIGNFRLEKMKLRVVNRTRFHNEKREIYAKFLAQADLAHSKIGSFIAYADGRDAWDIEADEAWLTMDTLRSQIEMVCTPEVLQAAKKVSEWYDECVIIVTLPKPVDGSYVRSAENAMSSLFDARSDFLEAVKIELSADGLDTSK